MAECLDLIGATSTTTGQTVRAELDTGTYPTGISRWRSHDYRHDFHGEWNHTLTPAPTDTDTDVDLNYFFADPSGRRQLFLGETLDVDQIAATYDAGVLTL